MSLRGNDPQEWAMKRRAAVERAKQLREERKNGANIVDDNSTFQPVINKRPSYLDSRPDTLDAQVVAGSAKQLVNSNDIFEQALPGNKNYNMNNSKIPISPSGDALGKEMKKFNYSNAPAGASKQQQPPPPIQPTTGYRSKFMQQYESDTSTSHNKYGSNNDYDQQYIPSNNINNKNSKAEKEAEEIFMSTLRSSNVNSNANYNKKSSVGPGWNDDTSTSGIFESTVNRTPNKGKTGSNSNALRPSPTQSYAHPDPPINRHKQQNYDNSSSGWNNDTSINPGAFKKSSPVKASDEPIISPRIRPSEDVAVTQARSRLSLLKSKIRKSESSGSSRSDSAYMRSNSAEYDDGVADNYNDYNTIHSSLPSALPKSAPAKKNISAPSSHRIPAEQSQQRRPSKPSINDANDASTYSSMYNSSSNRAGKSSQNNNYSMEEPQQVSNYKGGNNYDDADDYEYGGGMNSNQNMNAPMDLGEQHECPDCGRKFNSGPFEKHIKICKKVFQQKRKVFDSTKMRVQDNPELVKILKTKSKSSSSSNSSSAVAPKVKKQIAVPSTTLANFASLRTTIFVHTISTVFLISF
jgi:hypothetical protein